MRRTVRWRRLISAGTGYTVSSGSGSATVVGGSDDDVPEVSIAAGSGIAEGGDAVFTVTAVPAPYAALPVEVAVCAVRRFRCDDRVADGDGADVGQFRADGFH